MILGNIGSEKRTKYGVLGAAVNMAGRIESYTTAGQILISPKTFAAIEEELEVRQTLSIAPKGVTGEIQLSDITGIGGAYDLHMDAVTEKLLPLAVSVPVRFACLEGKHRSEERLAGEILAISSQEALLKTDAALAALDNICLDIGGELYAKLTRKEKELCRISFTAKPPCFGDWLSRISAGTAGGERHELT